MSDGMTIYVDELSISTLVQVLLPRARMWRLKNRRPLTIYYFSAKSWVKRWVNRVERLLGVRCVELDYTIGHIKDDQGELALYRVVRTDSLEICTKFNEQQLEPNPLIRRLGRRFSKDRLRLYLIRGLAQQLRPDLIRVNVVAWHHRTQESEVGALPIFYSARNISSRYLREYASGQGVHLLPYRRLPNLRFPRTYHWILLWARVVKSCFRKLLLLRGHGGLNGARGNIERTSGPVIAATLDGAGLSLDTSLNSDLFWVPFTTVAPGQLMVYSFRPEYPLDDAKLASLEEARIRYVATRQSASVSQSVPVWRPSASFVSQYISLVFWLVGEFLLSLWRRPANAGWLVVRLLEFAKDYSYWKDFFLTYRVRLHFFPNNAGAERIAEEQALADLGGINLSYQRSVATFPSASYASAVDVFFAHAPQSAELQRQSGSSIAQVVSTGYVYDRAFSGVRSRARGLRDQLQEHGASFIICYLDEHPGLDRKRAFIGREEAAANYEYLLNKLLADPSLGLIFKPKKPAILRHEMGAVTDLLEAAEATGRCHVFEEGTVSTPTLPCEAALAADVSIGLLIGGTASLECGLAGVPSVMLDLPQMTYHPLYGLGEGDVVFRSWDELWSALKSYRRDPKSAPRFGSWSAMLNTLDPFRDGRSAERIGAYVGSLAAGLERGLSREETLEQTGQRFAQLWGEDKVVRLR